jgi:hypothetical protein
MQFKKKAVLHIIFKIEISKRFLNVKKPKCTEKMRRFSKLWMDLCVENGVASTQF